MDHRGHIVRSQAIGAAIFLAVPMCIPVSAGSAPQVLSPRPVLSQPAVQRFYLPQEVPSDTIIGLSGNREPIRVVIFDVNGTLYEKERPMKLFVRIGRALWLSRREHPEWREKKNGRPWEAVEVLAPFLRKKDGSADNLFHWWSEHGLIEPFNELIGVTDMYPELVAEAVLFERNYRAHKKKLKQRLGFDPAGDQIARSAGVNPILWRQWKELDMPVHKSLSSDKKLRHALEDLRDAGITLFIVTNARYVNAVRIFAALGIPDGLFHEIMTFESFGLRKPASCSAVAEVLQRKYRIDLRSVVSIGDSQPDVVGALSLGMRAIGLGTIDTLHELPARINDYNVGLSRRVRPELVASPVGDRAVTVAGQLPIRNPEQYIDASM